MGVDVLLQRQRLYLGADLNAVRNFVRVMAVAWSGPLCEAPMDGWKHRRQVGDPGGNKKPAERPRVSPEPTPGNRWMTEIDFPLSGNRVLARAVIRSFYW